MARGSRKPRRSFGQLSRSSRDRIARVAEEYGFSRRSAREMYNRGTFNPLSRDASLHVPSRTSMDVLRRLARENVENTLRYTDVAGMRVENFKYNPDTVFNTIDNHMSRQALIVMATASEDDLLLLASVQSRKDINPDLLRRFNGLNRKNFGWVDDDGRWHNVFWYH